MLLLIMGGVAVTAIGVAIVLGVVLVLLFLLKLSFRELPPKRNDVVNPEQAPSVPADVK
jgi:hypothetical protein